MLSGGGKGSSRKCQHTTEEVSREKVAEIIEIHQQIRKLAKEHTHPKQSTISKDVLLNIDVPDNQEKMEVYEKSFSARLNSKLGLIPAEEWLGRCLDKVSGELRVVQREKESLRLQVELLRETVNKKKNNLSNKTFLNVE